jgi:CRP-like cAMP-binding protein
MPPRDFFTFCTSLQPLELKALGALSEARHVPEGVTIYEAGQPCDTVYIVNRGALEVIRHTSSSSPVNTYLARGDAFGDVETLTNGPSEFQIKTCEEVSLRCFRKEDFGELVKRVPSFFLFLAERLADRLIRAQNAVVAPPACLELSGSLKNFDLVTIYQTIVNSSQTGELSITADDGSLISAFFFEAGQPRGAQFEHLTGEEAFWQLFLAHDLPGTFSFTSGEGSITRSTKGGTIMRSAGDMLINALQARDEYISLKIAMPAETTLVERHKPTLDLGHSAPPALRSVMEQIWWLPFEGPIPLRALYSQLAVSELKVYQAINELLKDGHLTLAPVPLAAKVA